MADEQKDGLEPTQEGKQEAGQDAMQTEEKQGSLFEGIYDKLPDISVKAVDRFILICVIALVAVILVGVLKANHVF